MKQVPELIRFWETRPAQDLALATLVSARGSSYRRPGARMLIAADGASAGGVSAGCIEEEVIACARQVLCTGLPQLLTFDTRRRFGCHGAIDILVEVVADGLMAQLRDHVLQRESCRLATQIIGPSLGTCMAGFENTPGAFVQTLEPVSRLILIGDAADAAALQSQATLLGWDVVQLDTAPASADLLDDYTAVVLATHNYGRDCAALRNLLPAGLRYLGIIGSRRRREDLLFDVIQNGVAVESEVFAPAGLHLGADTPEEIALSVIAEIQCVFAGGTAEQLRHRRAPIHPPIQETVACAESAA